MPLTYTYPAPDISGAHYVVCGKSGSCAESTRAATDTESYPVRCCSDTSKAGWLKNNGCAVWGETEVDNGGCNHASTYNQAVSICSNAGARLCTRVELEADCTMDSGCSFNYKLVWSSTGQQCHRTTHMCTDGRFFQCISHCMLTAGAILWENFFSHLGPDRIDGYSAAGTSLCGRSCL